MSLNYHLRDNGGASRLGWGDPIQSGPGYDPYWAITVRCENGRPPFGKTG